MSYFEPVQLRTEKIIDLWCLLIYRILFYRIFTVIYIHTYMLTHSNEFENKFILNLRLFSAGYEVDIHTK